MTLDTTQFARMVGEDLVDRNGDRIGSIEELWQDDRTGQPAWASVRTGLFGGKHTLVPIEGAASHDGAVRVPYEKAQVKQAPAIDARELTHEQERELYTHYGMAIDRPSAGDVSRPPAARQGGDDGAMTRSEEEIVVGKQTHETGRVRLRKYVVTEDVETTIPLRHEEVRVEREPITEANRDQARSGPEIGEVEHEVVLHAEEPVVGKRTVPKERVRLEKTTEVEQAKISEQARKERIDVEGMDDPSGVRRDPDRG